MPRLVVSVVRFSRRFRGSGVSRLPRPITSTGKLNVHSSANQGRTPMTAKQTSGVIVTDQRTINCKCEAAPTECEAAPTEVAQPEHWYGSWRPQ